MTELIIKMPTPNRCVSCPVRLSCERYSRVLETSEDWDELKTCMPDEKCIIKGKLVRCGDCRHRGFLRRVSQSDPLEEIVDFPDWSRCPLAAGGLIMPDDFFCGRGERRVQSGDDER